MIDLEIYLWTAKLQRRVDSFVISDAADMAIDQKSNLNLHLSMLIVDNLNGGLVGWPQQLRTLVLQDPLFEDHQMILLFGKLKQWPDEYLKAEGVILERVAKAQRFSEYLLKKRLTSEVQHRQRCKGRGSCTRSAHRRTSRMAFLAKP